MKFTYVADPKQLLAAEHLLVLAPAATFGPRSRAQSSLTKLTDKATAALAMQLGREASVGLLGGAATSLRGETCGFSSFSQAPRASAPIRSGTTRRARREVSAGVS